MAMIALDTCFNGCSAALFAGDGTTLLAHALETMERGHAERLPAMVDELFRAAGVSPSSLNRVAVTRGPGTFTGLRIGLSYAKGLGLALSIPVIGIDSLTAIAVPLRIGEKAVVVSHKAGATGLHYAAKLQGPALTFIEPPALVDAATVAVWSQDADLCRDHAPDAANFGAFALALPPQPLLRPLYLREADAKPSAPQQFSSVTTRTATPADVPLLVHLHGESFEAPWTIEMLASALALPGSGALLVELANRAYGFVQFQIVAGEAEINTLCVSPIYRGQGFGKALLHALIQHLKTTGTTKLFLDVATDNGTALGLYRGQGFRQTGLRKGYYARPSGAVDAVLMVLDL